MTFALLSVRDRALTLEQVRAVIAPLLDHSSAREIPGPAADLRDASARQRDARDARRRRRRERLRGRRRAGLVDRARPPPRRGLLPQRHAAPLPQPGDHRARRCSTSRREPPEGDGADAAWQQALRYRDLLKFDFFFARKLRYSEQIDDEARRLGWDGSHDAGRGRQDHRRARRCSSRTASCARSSTRSSSSRRGSPRAAPSRSPTSGASSTSASAHGRQLLLQGRVHGADSVSRELFATALKLAANRELIAGDAGGPAAWLDELTDVRELLERIAQIDAARLEEVLDGDA